MPNLKELGDLGDRMMQGLPFGQGGAVSGTSNLDTFSSPDVTQDPSKFGTLSDKSNLTAADTQAAVTPFGPFTGQNPWDYVRDVEQIKYKVTPDEVITGMDYEMKKLVLKDRQVARTNVIKNLKKDPKYYSKLHMLGVFPDEKDEALMEVMVTLKAQKYAIHRREYF
jgi:hypothetical protein